MIIEIISGSARENSITKRIAIYLQQALSKARPEHNIGLLSMHDNTFPPVQKSFKAAAEFPADLQPFAQRILNADAFVLVSPEYNGSYSPAMKNMLDHFPKHKHKAFGIVTGSDGALGGMRAAQQLLLLVPALFGVPSPFLLIVPKADTKFDEQGQLTDGSFENSIHNFITEFLWLAEKLNS